MSWLRLDDNYDGHAKILRLGDGARGDARRWTWTRVLLYTMRQKAPVVPQNIGEQIPRASRPFLADCLELGLLDEEDRQLVVHDWILYTNRPIPDKVAYCLRVAPWASGNTIVEAIGGRRQQVLAEVKKQRGDVDPAGIDAPREGPPLIGARAVPYSRTGGSREPLREPLLVVPTPDPSRPKELFHELKSSPLLSTVAQDAKGEDQSFEERPLNVAALIAASLDPTKEAC